MDGIDMRVNQFVKDIVPHLGFDPTEQLVLMGFFNAPASSKHHYAYPGGLYDHSINVADMLVQITKGMHLLWSRPESPYIIGVLHDLCKCDQYVELDAEPGRPQKYAYVSDTLLRGHGEKSVMLASTLTKLTMEEVACIRYHMGAFNEKEEFTNAIAEYPNVLWTHTADMAASHILELRA